MNPLRIIFLDFDGVIVGPPDKFLPACMEALNEAIRQTQAGIVFSTSWRLVYSTEELEGYLRQNGLINDAVILGSIPIIEKLVTPMGTRVCGTRGQEIEAWISENKYEGALCVIDDLMSQCYPYHNFGVEVEYLHSNDVKAIINVFHRQEQDE